MKSADVGSGVLLRPEGGCGETVAAMIETNPLEACES